MLLNVWCTKFYDDKVAIFSNTIPASAHLNELLYIIVSYHANKIMAFYFA